MTIIVAADGSARTLYAETIDLDTLGALVITRAGSVEADEDGRWTADLGLVSGPTLGPFARRSEALAAEVVWLEAHRLAVSSRDSVIARTS